MEQTFHWTPHHWNKVKWMPWALCSGCGLVALKNDRTRWCIQHGCDFSDHPTFVAAMRRFNRMT